ncbi:transcription antitermination factor NusB [Thiolapillus brandeum]|uniref:Transcription antitermination protein NusB n=1 Tax=Thiolapillus brandeum TaxID=1076588 RepID=A0A7U6JHH0_9GAMM|nr:transcription antitermination factor NusB [Thiolapillus brandeum]BAO43777.1 N utilization substance protein B [Thiolapillus brandeum]
MSRKRSKSRSLATQAIYQWQVTGDNIGEIVNGFLAEHPGGDFQIDYFQDLVRGVSSQLDVLDDGLKPLLDRPVEEVDLVERAILRLGAYELLKHPEVPYRVVINEWVELAKTFGADKGHKYINGVLDKLAQALRPVEVAARKRG